MAQRIGSGASSTADAGSTSIAVTLTMSGGNTGVLSVKWETAGVTINTIVDSDGVSTWTLDQQGTNGGDPHAGMAYCSNLASTGSHTVTVNFTGGSATFRRAFLDEFSGLATSNAKDSSSTTATGSVAPYSAPAINTTRTGLVLFHVTDFNSLTGITAQGTPTFTLLNTLSDTFACYLISTLPQTVTPGATASTGVTQWVTLALALKDAQPAAARRKAYPNKGPRVANYGPRLLGARQGISTVTTQSFSYSATGGIIFSGTSAINRVRVSTPAGGLTFSGTSARNYVRVGVVSGGIVFGGSAAFAKGQTVSPSGGLVFGGTATQSRVKVENVSGGIVFGGAASVSFVGTLTYSYTASGGIVFGGVSAINRIRTVPAAGGLLFGGSSGVSYFTVGGGPVRGANIRRLFTFLRKHRSQ